MDTLISPALPTADGGPVPSLAFTTLPQLLKRSVAAHGPRPLFGTKNGEQWEWLSYSQFNDLVDRMRGGLASLNVGKGDRVAMIAANRLEWAVCAYATYGLGGVFVPMYETQTDKDWEYILKDCAAKVAFVSSQGIRERVNAFQASLPELRHVVTLAPAYKSGLDYQQLLERGDAERRTVTLPEPGDLATLIYTSGTTGEPKGVMLTHGNIATNIAAVKDLFPIGRHDRSLSFLPWAHAFGHTVELHLMLAIGASIAVCEGVEKLIANLAETRPTILFAVPKIFNKIYNGVNKQMVEKPKFVRSLFNAGMIVAEKKRTGAAIGPGEYCAHGFADMLVFSKIRKKFGGKLRFAVSGGAALAKEVAEFIDALGIQVYEGYGLTETSPIATCNFPGNRKLGSVGKPIAGVRVSIEESGEIVIAGPNVMVGYLNRPEATAEVMKNDGSFRSGDMGSFDEDGFLRITGRIKEQYKLENGKYVAPSPLEEQLKLSPLIVNAMIYGDNRPHNVALIVPDPQAVADKSEAEVRALMAEEIKRCSSEFKGYEKVMDFAIITEDFTQENGMLTPTMKLKRRNVMTRWGEVIESLYK